MNITDYTVTLQLKVKVSVPDNAALNANDIKNLFKAPVAGRDVDYRPYIGRFGDITVESIDADCDIVSID